MKLDVLFTTYFQETEYQFDNSVVLIIDVFRAATTVCAALYNGAKEIIPYDTTEKAIKIYNSLSREVRFLGGERNGIKPAGFDAGNSPLEYSQDKIKNKTIILTTSNGTLAFQKAKRSALKIITCFVNLNAVANFLLKFFDKGEISCNKLIILCAGSGGKLSYEDCICAGAIINQLKSNLNFIQTDSARIAQDLYNVHSNDLFEFLKTTEHALFLSELNFYQDIIVALSQDIYPVIPLIEGGTIRNYITN